VAGTFDLPSSGMLSVFSPSSPYTESEAQQLHGWVSSGGVLVYASDRADEVLDPAFNIRRSVGVEYTAATGVPPLNGVGELAGGTALAPFGVDIGQVAIVRGDKGQALGYIETVGSGKAIVLADPLELVNANLNQDSNARMLIDLLALAPSATVAIDEFHHGYTLGDITPRAWLLTPFGAAIAWLVLALFVGFVLRGRAFGPRVPVRAPGARAAAEWTAAVGALLRRAGGRKMALEVLAAATQRAVAARLGLPVAPHDRLEAALRQRAPELAATLAEAERSLILGEARDDAFRDSARKLHRLAYPFSAASKE
jgi:hypothetical protein